MSRSSTPPKPTFWSLAALLAAFIAAASHAWVPFEEDIVVDPELKSGDRFGQSVAVSGNTVVVGAGFEDSGAIYIYERHLGAGWELVKRIPAPINTGSDEFGAAVALDGDVLVVGAPGFLSDQGAGYIFERNRTGAGEWGLLTTLSASGGAAGDRFGEAVAVEGDIAVVGAIGDDHNSFADPGSAFVFERSGVTTFAQIARVEASDPESFDRFGASVDISFQRIVVGAPEKDSVDGDSSGAAYVYQRNIPGEDSWGQIDKITAPSPGLGDVFGIAVAIDRDLVLVGASGANEAYIFERNDLAPNAYAHLKTLFSGESSGQGNAFGAAVDIRHETAVVTDDGQDNGGAAYVYSRHAFGINAWTIIDVITATGQADTDRFGSAASLGHEVLVVGSEIAPSHAPGGFAAILSAEASAWQLVQRIDASPEELDVDGAFAAVSTAESLLLFNRSGTTGFWSLFSGFTAADDVSLEGDQILYSTSVGSIPSLRALARANHPGALSEQLSVTLSDQTAPARVALDGHGAITGTPESTPALVEWRRPQGNWSVQDSATLGPGIEFGTDVAIDGQAAMTSDKPSGLTPFIFFYRRDSFGPDSWSLASQRTDITFLVDTLVVDLKRDIGVAAYQPAAGGFQDQVAIFRQDLGGVDDWGLVNKLVSPGSSDDAFAASVSTDGELIAVGAPNADILGVDTGAVYLFDRDHSGEDDSWLLREILIAGAPEDGDHFGKSVALFDGHLVVGSERQTLFFEPTTTSRLGDLEISIESAPASAIPGTSLPMSYQIINSTPDTVITTLLLLFSEDSQCSRSDQEIDAFLFNLPTGTHLVERNHSLPVDLMEEESYTLCAYIDSSDVVPESDEDDNIDARPILFVGSDAIFVDSFESGDTSAWTSTVP